MFAEKIKITIASFLAMLVMASCTEVDFCFDDEQPHYTEVQINFDWQNNTLVDSMYVVAYRVVNSWNCGYMYDVNSGSGSYKYNAYTPGAAEEESPAGGESGTDNVTEGDAEPAMADATAESSPFYTKTGELRFLAISYTPDNNTFSYGNDFLGENAIRHSGIVVHYKTYDLSSPLLTYADGWKDLNPYAKYIISSDEADKVYACYTEPMGISDGRVNTVDITPVDVCQDIEFRFDIAAEGVTIDKVVAEISGVSAGWLFSSEKPISGTTYKMLFPVKNNGSGYSGNISVFGLSRGKTWGQNGAGVLQLAIHATKSDGTAIVYNMWMNLYNTISAIGSPIYGSQDTVVLDINSPIKVTPNGVTFGHSTTEGDRWTQVK